MPLAYCSASRFLMSFSFAILGLRLRARRFDFHEITQNSVNRITIQLRSDKAHFPLLRPEHRSFFQDQPARGAARMPLVSRRGWEAPSAPPEKSKMRRIKAESGCRFFWVLFFGHAKKSTAAAGPRTGIKQNRRDSDTLANFRTNRCR
jgi:hypothetical protein